MKLQQLINIINIIKVGYKCRKKIIQINFIKSYLNLLNFLYKKGLILNWLLNNNKLTIILRYANNKPCFNKIKIITTPGFRIYKSKRKNIKYYKDNVEIILLTSKGILEVKEAQSLGIGGEVFFIIYY